MRKILCSMCLFASIFTSCKSKIYFFGDSVVCGNGASDLGHRWTTLLCKEAGMKEINMGVGASTLEKQDPINPFGTTNLIDRLNTIPKKASDDKFIIFLYGQNDANANYPNYDTVNFKADYRKVLKTCLNNGWKATDIILVSPPYLNDSGFNQYSKGHRIPAITKERYSGFVDAVRKISQEYHTNYTDIYKPLFPGHFNSNDFAHPDNTGHKIIASTIMNTAFN